MATFIPSFEIKDISKEFNTQEEANKYLESLVDEPGAVQYANKKVEKKTEQLDTQKPENELIKSIEGIEWLRKGRNDRLREQCHFNFVAFINKLFGIIRFCGRIDRY